jgi:hypothetical protein
MLEVDLENIEGMQYVGQIYFGNPPQPMKMQFDTGSSGVYLVTEECQHAGCDSEYFKKYDPSKSSYF